MIVDRITAERIQSGRKTQHRIPRKPTVAPVEDEMVVIRDLVTGEEKRREPLSAFTRETEPRAYRSLPITVMKGNHDLGFQRKPRPRNRDTHERDRLTSARPTTDNLRREGVQVCRVRLLEVTPALLHEIAPLDVIAEGFKARADFFDYWRAKYNEGPGVEGTDSYPIEIPVWVQRFELDRDDRPRYLSTASDVNRGYSESAVTAVKEDGEAVEGVSDEWLDRFAEEAEDDKLKERRRAEREAVQKLPGLLEDFDDPTVIDRQLRAIKRQVDSIERTRAAIERRRAA